MGGFLFRNSSMALAFLWIFSIQSDAYRILAILSLPLKSHFNFNNALVLSLASAGHHATIYSPFSQHNSSLLTYIDTETDIRIAQANRVKKLGISGMLKVQSLYVEEICHSILDRRDINDILNSHEKFYDILITELPTVHCFQSVATKLRIPVIATVPYLSYSEADRLTGNPHNPSYIPFLLGNAGLNMNFFQRLKNVCTQLVVQYYYRLYTEDYANKMNDQYFPEIKQFKQTGQEVSLVFSNSHPGMIPRPNVPNMIEVGGLHVTEPKKLPKDIETFINDSKAGVIVVSFGSTISGKSLSTKVINAFKYALSKVPQRVIWKFEGSMDDVPSNILLMEWLPQTDILAHKNVKAFISHCGLSSIYEAIRLGIPIIAVPVGVDQKMNGAVLEDLGIAIRLNFDEIQATDVLRAVNSIVNETRYGEKMRNLSQHIFNDRIMSQREAIVYWTEYVIRYDGALHLRSTAQKLWWFQYLLVDVNIFIITIITVVTLMIQYALRKFFRILCRFRISYQNK